ncbi:hypothetical protein [Peribacillus asahii]|uniref:hypothetical protein n=1 Tax=Peribacillus asahii TaxID=228899 RepID=UPI00207A5319|nr:hypothetical protein [Peribacillus asahii]USK71764.1 hypothetical protein LIS76_08425 [Peribacillus asahii]
MTTEKNVEAKVTKEEVKVSKFGKQEKHTVKGVEYTFQFPGTRKTQEILDAAKVYGGFSDTKYHEDIMEHVIISPLGVDWNYWDENDGYREVMTLADNFLGRQL